MKLFISFLVVFLLLGYAGAPLLACCDNDCSGQNDGAGACGGDGCCHESDPDNGGGDGSGGGCSGDSCHI